MSITFRMGRSRCADGPPNSFQFMKQADDTFGGDRCCCVESVLQSGRSGGRYAHILPKPTHTRARPNKWTWDYGLNDTVSLCKMDSASQHRSSPNVPSAWFINWKKLGGPSPHLGRLIQNVVIIQSVIDSLSWTDTDANSP